MMELYQKRSLAKWTIELQEELNTSHVTKFLVEKNVLTNEDEKRIEAETLPNKRVDVFLEVLKEKEGPSFDVFLEAMQLSTDYDDIVENLKSTEKELKEDFVAKFQSLLNIVGENKGNFIFWRFVFNISELMIKSEALQICKYFKFEKDIEKSIKKSEFPGFSFMIACCERNITTANDCSKVCDAIAETGLSNLLLVAEKYKTLISYHALHLTLENFTPSAQDDVFMALKRNRKLDTCCKKQYGVSLDYLLPGKNKLVVRIPHTKALEDLCIDIKSGKFAELIPQIEKSPKLRITFTEDAIYDVKKHLSENAGYSPSFATCEENKTLKTGYSSGSEENESDSEEHNEDIAGGNEKDCDYSKSDGIPPFGLLLQQVSQDMNMEHCKNVATMICLPTADFDHIGCGADLLRIMVQRNEVAEDRVSYLRRLLTQINLKNAVEKIEKYERIFCYESEMHRSSETADNLTWYQDSAEMSALHRKVLFTIMSELSQKMDLRAAVEFMLKKHSFTKAEKEEMLSFENNSGRTIDFIKILNNQTYAVYEGFHEFLVSNYPKIAKEMKKVEVRLAKNSPLWKVMMSTKMKRLNKRATFSIDGDAIEECRKTNEKLSIVLVGKTGSGKSSTGNTILGRRKAFKTSPNLLKSFTKTNHLERVYAGNLLLCVMDTPGLFDTNGKMMDNQSVLLEIAKAVIDFPEGIDVFVIVCRIDTPFTEEEHKSIENIEKRFGTEIFQHSILVLTRGSQMESETLSEHLSPENIPLYLRKLIEKVSWRAIVVENKPTKEHFRDIQHNWIIAAICSFVKQKEGSSKYTNEQFNAIQELIKRNQKKAEDYTLVKDLTTAFVHNFIKTEDETTLMRIKQKTMFDQHEMASLIKHITDNNLFNEYIRENFNSIIEKVISENKLVIEQKVSSLIAERNSKAQFEFQKRRLLLENILNELKQKETLKINEILHARINKYMSNNSGENLRILLNCKQVPNEVVQDIDETISSRFIAPKNIIEMAKEALESKTEMVKMKIQSQLRQEEKVTSELCHLFENLSLGKLMIVKQNNELDEEQQLSLRQKLQESMFEIDNNDVIKNLAHKIIQENIDKFIKMKEFQINEEKRQKRAQNLLQMKNKINNFLFDFIEKANEEQLKSLQNMSYPNVTDVATLIELGHSEGIKVKDIEEAVKDFLNCHKSSIEARYEQKRRANLEFEKRIFEQMQIQEKKKRAEEEVMHIADNDVKDFLRGLQKKDLQIMKAQIENDELPSKLFKEIKSKLSPENSLDDEDLRKIIWSVLKLKKEMLMQILSESCFPSKTVVMSEKDGEIPISSVKIGMKVLTLTGQSSLGFEEIFFMAHSNKDAHVSYINIETASKKSLLVSPDHCLPVGELRFMKAAKKINVNDVIFTSDKKNIVPDVVTSVRYEFQQGAFCPYTLNGTIVVDNIVASCFTTTVAPNIAQAVLSPLRLLYRCTPSRIYTLLFSSRNMQLISVNAQRGARYCKQKTNHLLKKRMEFTL